MTHDELLAKITNGNISYKAENLALRAIVELHKPTGWFEDTGYADQECIHCDNGSYPCPTIQKIIENLK